MLPAHSKRGRCEKEPIDRGVRRALAVARKRASLSAFEELLAAVRANSDLLRPLPPGGRSGWEAAEPVLRGLLGLADERRYWIRDPAGWTAFGFCRREQFASLARHLLASHPVPEFLVSIWFETRASESRRLQRLYRHLAQGHNLRGFALPMQLTKPMVRFFCQAPAHFTVGSALRWCQVRGVGGSPDLANAVAATHLATSFASDAFWRDVIEFLIAWRDLEPRMVPFVVDFLRHHPAQFFAERRRDPEFRQRLLLEVRRRSAKLELDRPPKHSWAPSRIKGFEYVETRQPQRPAPVWTIRELTNSHDLIVEGRELRHCVARYTKACADRATTIWSLERSDGAETDRHLTIQLDPTRRRILQARGKFNRPPQEKGRQILQLWAEANRLKIGTL
jgi:PcfJ-like protein